jgi:hypothetical protein
MGGRGPSKDRTLKVCNLERGRELRTLVGHNGVNGVHMQRRAVLRLLCSGRVYRLE